MPIDGERERLRVVCGDLLRRQATDVFTVQVERVLQHIKAGDCTRVRAPEDVVEAFQKRGLAPRCGLAPRAMDLAVAFGACVFPRRLPPTEWKVRFRLLEEVYQGHCMSDATEVVERLRCLGRLPANAADKRVFGLLNDLTAASPGLGGRDERQAGAALFVATMPRATIMGTPGGKGPRFGALRNWEDDGEFLRFFRSEHMTGPPSSYSRASVDDYGAPSWGGVLQVLEAKIPASQRQFAGKAVDMEKMLWSRRPRAVSTDDYGYCVHSFWTEQNEKLNSGFPQYGFESHFVEWWRVCAENLRNEVLRILDRDTRLARDLAAGAQARGIKIPRRRKAEPLEINPEMARILREGWRLVRTTFHVRGHRNPPVDNEALRRDLDELWRYHVEKDLTQAGASETIQQLIERTGAELNENTAATLVRRIKSRFRAYNLARLQGLTNGEIRDHLKATGAALEPALDTVAALARPIDRMDTLLWAFLAHVFLRSQIDTDHKDEWGLLRCAAEFRHWGGDPLFPGIIADGLAQGRRPYATFQEALAELLKDKPESDPLKALRAGIANAMSMFANHQYGDLSAAMVAWAMRLVDATVQRCGYSVYQNLRLVFDVKETKAGSEWIVPSWYLVFIEGLLNRGPGTGDTELILKRLKAETEEEKRAVRRILTSMRLHCEELREEALREAK